MPVLDTERPTPRLTLCPYCGANSRDPEQCSECGGLFEPLSRQASQNAMGPWFIRAESSAWKPGCSLHTLRTLIARGKVTPETVLRGPATRQFWAHAKDIPGIANRMGICHACKAAVGPDDHACPECNASFAVETDRQYLGLGPHLPLPDDPASTQQTDFSRPLITPRRLEHQDDQQTQPTAAAEQSDTTWQPLLDAAQARIRARDHAIWALIAGLALSLVAIVMLLIL